MTCYPPDCVTDASYNPIGGDRFQCKRCGQVYEEKEVTIGGDGYGGRCAALADVPVLVPVCKGCHLLEDDCECAMDAMHDEGLSVQDLIGGNS